MIVGLAVFLGLVVGFLAAFHFTTWHLRRKRYPP